MSKAKTAKAAKKAKKAKKAKAAVKRTGVRQRIRQFMQTESAGGIILLGTTIFALILANTPFSTIYHAFLDTIAGVQIGGLEVKKPLLLWINDGLMAIFFFLIGLEIKREFCEGELSSFDQVILPLVGALGGMVAPAAIYLAFNYANPEAISGWAIPVATDIAFALALLIVFGTRVPLSLKVFLLTLAIFDDLAAIIIIALFYSASLNMTALMFAFIALIVAFLMNKRGVTQTSPYILIGAVLWLCVLKSGVHATLAGVIIAFFIPMRDEDGDSPLKELEHDLHPPVAFAILPIFAFANAGLYLLTITSDDIFHPITLGVVLGLLLGKPIGVMSFVWLADKLRIAKLPPDITWPRLFGVSIACGIGFTMSLFIAGLAFQHDGAASSQFAGDRLGILIGSALSALVGYIVLDRVLPKKALKP